MFEFSRSMQQKKVNGAYTEKSFGIIATVFRYNICLTRHGVIIINLNDLSIHRIGLGA